YLTAVAAGGPSEVWAVGQGLFHWDGSAWTERTADLGALLPPGARLALTGVTVPRPGEVWAAGVYYSGANTAPTPILLHEDGAGWQRVEGQLPVGVGADLLAGIPGQEGIWAAGQGTAHWDGVRWTAVPVPAAVNRGLTALSVLPDGTAWALSWALPGTGGSQILRWDGQRWSLVASAIATDPTAGLNSLAIEGPNDVWAVGARSYPTEPGIGVSFALTVHIFNPCALPTVALPDPHAPGARYFAPTGHTLRGVFRTYWELHGGLAQFGYPLTEEFPEKNALNGQVYTVQYFERNRFEYHPEYAGTAYEVLLGLLGRTVTARIAPDFSPFQPVPAPPTGRYFPETGHTLAPEFALYWAQHGGLAVYGFPISEPYREISRTDGKDYLVQYFERNRLEYHPEYRGTPSEVLLGLLGADVLKARGWLP
ncbi:MAG TPA: hypothetical protein VKY74_15810, partial [Chloroflexia bacterium]|nr:hypothetical protein [Chloroflexia bacterium]